MITVANLYAAINKVKPYPHHIEMHPRDFYEMLGSISFHEQDLFSNTTFDLPAKFKGIPIIQRPGLIGWRIVARNWREFEHPADQAFAKNFKPSEPHPTINWQSDDFDETEALKIEKARAEYEQRRGW